MTTPIEPSDSSIHGPSEEDIQAFLDKNGLGADAKHIYDQLQMIFEKIDQKNPNFWDEHGLEIENAKVRLVEHQGDGNEKLEAIKDKLMQSQELSDTEKSDIKGRLEEVIRAHLH